MSFPAITEIVQTDLFTSETELKEKYPQASVERLLWIRAMYNWLISNPESKDKEFVDGTVSRYGVSKVLAYDELKFAKQSRIDTFARDNACEITRGGLFHKVSRLLVPTLFAFAMLGRASPAD